MFKGIQQLAAKITTISDDYIDDHIDENPPFAAQFKI